MRGIFPSAFFSSQCGQIECNVSPQSCRTDAIICKWYKKALLGYETVAEQLERLG